MEVKANKWWWPPDRKKAKLLQALVNDPVFKGKVEQKILKAWRDEALHGRLVSLSNFKLKDRP